jgi:hypothetical protein
MWLLLIVLLIEVPGINQVTVLNTFATYDACQTERNRIGYEMAESYPGENDFRIVCEFQEGVPKVPIGLLHRAGDDVIGARLAGTVTWNPGAGLSCIVSVPRDSSPLISAVHTSATTSQPSLTSV